MDKKREANWRYKWLENLEKDAWGSPTYGSHLVTTVYKLRKVPLNEFTIENLRIMIGQNVGLLYLIPLAIERLTEYLFCEGDFYEGDLLEVVLRADPKFWKQNFSLWQQVYNLINPVLDDLDSRKISYSDFLKIYSA